MSTKPQNTGDEVDLGSLFLIIGNGFKKFFNFIGKILASLFHFFILILLFLKENIIKLAIATIVGGGIGVYFEMQKEDSFGSDLIVQPNFNSARQLYENVNYYNELVEQEEINTIASTFGISEDEAKSITGFEVKPIKSENDILASYDELVLSVDTLTVQSYSYEKFKDAFTKFDYEFHQVHVEAKENNIFGKLGEPIISSVVNNDYLKRSGELTKQNLFKTDSIVKQNLAQVDSLRQVYLTVLLEEAKKPISGTNIDMGGAQRQPIKELELFKTNRTLYYELQKISDEISENSEVINVIADFQPVGYKVGGLSDNKIVRFAFFAFMAMVGFVLLLRLNTYLDNYKKA